MKLNRAIPFIAATALGFTAMSTQAAVVTGTFSVSNASLTALYSGTLDAPCTTDGGQFFTCTDVAEVMTLATSIAITDTNTNSGGTLVLQYEDTTGEILSVDSLNLSVNDMSIDIVSALGNATVTIVGGNGVPGANDVPTLLGGTAGSNGSADADSNAAANIFQHDAPGTENDATDFSTFTDVVDTCTAGSPVCGLIPLLAIDGLRYELTGLVSASGDFSLALRSETSNNSNYFVDITAAAIPVPAAVWLFGSALGLLAWVRRRVA